MAVTYDPIPGKNNVISVASRILPVRRYATDINGEMLDVTNFMSGGYREFIDGLAGGNIILSGVMPRTNNPFRSPIRLKARTLVTDVRIKLSDGNDGLCLIMPKAWVTRWQCDGDAPGVNTYVVSFLADGPFQDFSQSNA